MTGRIWCLYFIDALEGTATSLMEPYVLSDFLAHSLVAVTPIMAGIIGGVWRAPLAKIMDIWGRPEAFLLMVASLALGQAMMAGSNNPQTYAAAKVFVELGYVRCQTRF
jgi:MFS family permease